MSQFPSYIYNPFGLGAFGMWSLPPIPQRVDTVPAPTKPTGEAKSGDQLLASYYGVGSADMNWLSGFADAPPGGYRLWRMMAKQPTLSLARRLVIGAMLTASRSFEVRLKPGQKKKRKKGPIVGDAVISDPLDKRAEFVDGVLTPKLPKLIKGMCGSLVLGHKVYEQVWGIKDGMDVITRFKPLRNEVTHLLKNDAGDIVGVRSASPTSVELYGPDFFNFANVDLEDEDYPYGSSRMENCREQWWFGLQQWRKLAELTQKAVGISMALGGPANSGQKDATGAPVDGPVAAGRFATEIAKQRPVYYARNTIPFDPERFGDAEYMKAWAAANEARQWKLEQFDWGDTAPAALAILAQLNKLDAEFMRAWFRPEREATEGKHGNKSESIAMGDIGDIDSDLVHGDCCCAISEKPINDLLERNFGPDARDSVYLDPSPIQDAQKQFLSTLLTDLLSNPQNSQDFYGKLDKTKAAADLDLEIRKGIDANEEPKPLALPVGAPPPNGTPANGNGNGRMNGNGNGGVKLSREDLEVAALIHHVTNDTTKFMNGEDMPTGEIGGRFSRIDEEQPSNVEVMEKLGEMTVAMNAAAERPIHVEVNNPAPNVTVEAPPAAQITLNPQIVVPSPKRTVKHIEYNDKGKASRIVEE